MATGARIRWYGEEVQRLIHRDMLKRMHVAVNHLKQATRRNLNRHKTRVHGPSKIGDIPHVDTGNLRDSIFSRVDAQWEGVTGDVGTKLDYGIHHEIKGRPFLRPTLKMEENALRRILTTGKGALVLDISRET